ncbi:MAG: AAA family ATPase [bacterium]|nr:AAA family ATPase [bacterium]
MSYYKVLGLEKEPFSTSPDPAFFFESLEHKTALTNILIEIRLRRGLSVILGDVGTGKTTLSRKLFQMLGSRENIDFFMILDPNYETEFLFLMSLVKTLGLELNKDDPTVLDLREEIKRFLFQRGVNEKRTVVLLIDEVQKLNAVSLEVLRILLNYETNEFKLLQLVLLGQMEFLPTLVETRNLMDRVSLKYTLGPLNEEETRKMIEFRIAKAGYQSAEKLFSDRAYTEIHKYTRGYPRRISMLCHKALKSIVMGNKLFVDEKTVQHIINSEVKLGWQKEDQLLKNNY